MPQRTKGGLQPTRQHKFPESHKDSQNTAPILNILIQMKNMGKSEYSIKFVDKALTYISQHANLNEPEQVKQFIANLQTTTGYKKNLCLAYNKYAKHYEIQWQMPLYTPEAKTIKIPTTEKIEMLIASSGRILSLKLTISKETGLRPIELCRLKVKDIDLDHKTINPTTAKKGNARTIPMSPNLTAKLQEHIAENNLSPSDLRARSRERAVMFMKIKNIGQADISSKYANNPQVMSTTLKKH